MKIKSLIVALAALFVGTAAFAQDPVNEVKKMYNEALSVYKSRNFTEAIVKLQEVVDAAFDVDAMEIATKAQNYIPSCYYYIGGTLANQHKFDEALENLAKAEELAKLYNNNKVLRDVKPIISTIYKTMGANSFNNKEYAAAAEVFVKGYEANPQDTDLALYLAMSYCEMKDFEKGVQVYTEVIALENRHSKFAAPAAKAKQELTNYLLVKAQEENAAGDKEAAYATLEILVNADPMNTGNQMYRLQLAASNQDWDNVIAWSELAAAFMVTPEDQSDVYYLVAVAYDTKNENLAAIENYKLVTAGDKLEASKKRIVELEEFVKAQAEAK